MTTLTDIRSKVRNVTGRYSSDQLSDSDLDAIINNWYQYNLPENLRLINLKVNYSFNLQPNVAVYPFNRNMYFTVEPPAYLAGYQIQFFQDQQSFYDFNPQIRSRQSLSVGTGVAGPYFGNISSVPIQLNSVFISTIDIAGNSLVAQDNGAGGLITGQLAVTGINQAANAVVTVPGLGVLPAGTLVYLSDVQGMTQINGGPYAVVASVPGSITININSTAFSAYTSGGLFSIQSGTINYQTGLVTGLIWPNAIAAGQTIWVQSVNYSIGRPFAVLFFNDQFTFSQWPDIAYPFQIQAYIRPTALAAGPDAPQLNEWWELLAYGAALKIIGDALDMDAYAKVQVLYDQQLRLAERRTLKQLSTQRARTIYSDYDRYPYAGSYPYV